MNLSSFEGVVLDPSKCSELSMEEKRELVYQVSQCPQAPQILQSWSRQEILQILCAEMGKQRKYTGLTKLKIIENLLKLVSEKNSEGNEIDPQSSPAVEQMASKRQRKTDHPKRHPLEVKNVLTCNGENNMGNIIYCKNSACRAKLSREHTFCKRCSCCICCQYDDNKDPSLWLTCNSEPPFLGDSCGMSCHLECALRHENIRIANKGIDGCFLCVSCGKVNDLIGCWRKQLMTAKDTRRVDILCYRVSLIQKLLVGSKCYQKLFEIVNEAAKKLEADVGPLTGLPVKKARGIVNRLCSGPEVQRLCGFAVESLDLMLSGTSHHVSSNQVIQESSLTASKLIRFEDVCSSSLTVVLGCEDPWVKNTRGYRLWHRKDDDVDYPVEPTCTLFTPNTRFSLTRLNLGTEYVFKVVCFDETREVSTCEVKFWMGDEVANSENLIIGRSESPTTNSSSPSSVEDETNNIVPPLNEAKNTEDSKNIDQLNLHKVGTCGEMASMLDEEGEMRSLPNCEALDFVNQDSPEGQTNDEMSTDNGSNTHFHLRLERVPIVVGTSEAELPITPCKLENITKGLGRSGRCTVSEKDRYSRYAREEEEPPGGSSSKKRCGELRNLEHSGNDNRDFEHYVKVIRWLECEGHIETSFRQKFLTWYSLRATPQEVRVVKVFVDTLIDDPASLAEQLLDAFSEAVSTKRSSVAPSGFCLKLWH